ncbi:molybdopterin-binding oxidoreductase [Nocardia sp. NPDC048505]|uniref:molybdopterin-binding oxidoreductase n=1 Tax=unclassified Nocardia TaxID=2637762 RepID=UPI0033E6B024
MNSFSSTLRTATHRSRIAAIITLTCLALVTGCGTNDSSDATPSVTPQNVSAVDGVRLEGALGAPQALTLDALRGFASRSQQVSFDSSAGRQTHSYDGPLLLDVLNTAQPKADPAAKNGLLRLAIVVTGADGYSATLAWAEIAPEFAGQQVLLALSEDGRPLARPRLTTPGDRKGGRYISEVVRIRVVDAAR